MFGKEFWFVCFVLFQEEGMRENTNGFDGNDYVKVCMWIYNPMALGYGNKF